MGGVFRGPRCSGATTSPSPAPLSHSTQKAPSSSRSPAQTEPRQLSMTAAFLFPAADDSHQGDDSCVYENYVFSHNFSLTVTAKLHHQTHCSAADPTDSQHHLLPVLQEFGSTSKRPRNRRPNVTTPAQDLNIRLLHPWHRLSWQVSSMDLYVNAMEIVSLRSRAEAGGE
uniref:uncharacterized protein sst5 isoform X1 n=1 Tax=Oncorhynchus gorbuscha TaxID=8017 RepID=UPI001EAF539B|nr:uncharacterized protein sst5 isoform X1 [Oncorhynchus gorbuscha]